MLVNEVFHRRMHASVYSLYFEVVISVRKIQPLMQVYIVLKNVRRVKIRLNLDPRLFRLCGNLPYFPISEFGFRSSSKIWYSVVK